MGYKKSKHYKAVLKYVKEKEIVLRKEAQSIMNGSINSACEQLASDGKIKMIKVKIRFKNGNLNDAWALYVHGIDYNKVIEFEKELVNRPFKSPLKEHHCYKRTENSITEIDHNSNVIDMQEYIQINNKNVEIKDYQGVRVVSMFDIAKLHNKEVKHVNEKLKRHEKHLIEGIDYFTITRNSSVANCDPEKLFTNNSQQYAYLFTETGYLMLVKSFRDDLSWTVQRELVNTYFKVKQLKADPETKNIPQVQNIKLYDVMEMMVGEMRSHDDRITQLENVIGGIANALNK